MGALFLILMSAIASFVLQLVVVHWLINIVFAFYGIKLMSYGVAAALIGLIWTAKGLDVKYGKE